MLVGLRDDKGSSLLELLVVLTTLTLTVGVATATLFPFYQKCLDAARDVRVLGDLYNLSLTLDAYYIFHAEYPRDPAELELPLQSSPEGVEYTYCGGGDSYELVARDEKGVKLATARGHEGNTTLEKEAATGIERLAPSVLRSAGNL
ncbi:hypothetical protein [Desulfothermobacter acidiphilus]|uniref:hypothetical protein n=1 Tax=Desulfothermobacter acidiphilus TaxID=1938353 RepID=UPI003F8AAB25